MEPTLTLGPLFEATSLFRRKKYQDCVDVCTKRLRESFDKRLWCLKLRALTQQVMVNELETEEETIGEAMMDDNSLAELARPGTSLRTTSTSSISPAIRPVSQGGRPLSGVVRPLTMDRTLTADQALRTPRTGLGGARPGTSASGRTRLATAAMMAQSEDGPFLDVSKLDLAKYAAEPAVAKALFEYIWYWEKDARQALELAALATQACQFQDWWWKLQLGRCYFRFGLYRDAEKQFKSALNQQPMVETLLWLSKVYLRLDQPLSAIEVLQGGLQEFPQDTRLLTHLARIYEKLNDLAEATKLYRDILQQDSMHIEAIACIAMNHFYTDQPELALRFYRRILQMGIFTAELYTNIGMCCFHAQQFDMAITCFERALVIASDDVLADIWYNISHVMVGCGDLELACHCLRLTVAYDNNHAEAYNNLGVLEMHLGNTAMAQSYFQASRTMGSYLFEPHYNCALLAQQIQPETEDLGTRRRRFDAEPNQDPVSQAGNLQESHQMVQLALAAFPGHLESQSLLEKIKKQFTSL